VIGGVTLYNELFVTMPERIGFIVWTLLHKDYECDTHMTHLGSSSYYQRMILRNMKSDDATVYLLLPVITTKNAPSSSTQLAAAVR
jgi:hypothetical protein